MNLESLLNNINRILSRGEAEDIASFQKPRLPVVFVIGAPRSGTTLTMQWLASTGQFSFPNNILSRFYQAPYTGSLITQLLTDERFHFRDEFKELRQSEEPCFESSLGKTAGIRQPNEFWYYWRRFFPLTVPQPLEKEQFEQMDPAGFAQGIAAIESVFGLPFATKGMLLQYDLDVLDKCFDGQVIFLFVNRDLIQNARSLLSARIRFFGDENHWYSARPRQFEQIKDAAVEEQVIGQIYYTNKNIEQQLSALPERQVVKFQYEEFCASPSQVYAELAARMTAFGHELGAYQAASQFTPSNRPLDPKVAHSLQQAAENLASGSLS